MAFFCLKFRNLATRFNGSSISTLCNMIRKTNVTPVKECRQSSLANLHTNVRTFDKELLDLMVGHRFEEIHFLLRKIQFIKVYDQISNFGRRGFQADWVIERTMKIHRSVGEQSGHEIEAWTIAPLIAHTHQWRAITRSYLTLTRTVAHRPFKIKIELKTIKKS